MKMTYDGEPRTVRHGPRVLVLERGTVDVHPLDVALARELGATLETGDPERDRLEDRTVDELRELAAEAEITGRSSMSKAELVDALTAGPEQE